MENKLETINKLFEGKNIRTIWDKDKEEFYFSVVDIISVLTDSKNPRNYWNMLKKRMTEEEKSELYTNCVQSKMKAPDGKMRETDTLDTEGIFRLIQSVPSPKAEPLKLWLAKLGRERVDETLDPSLMIDRAVQLYRKKGHDDNWIEKRIKGILDRNKLTDVWKEGGITAPEEYAILTNEIYRQWSGFTAKQYKEYKNLKKESLRDNMSDIEITLTDLGEIATREIAKKRKPIGLNQNKDVAKKGGNIAKISREALEEELEEDVIKKPFLESKQI